MKRYGNFTKWLLILGALPLMAFAQPEQQYKLEGVWTLSRHGVRAPLTEASTLLTEATPNKWPTWQTKGGYLTPKGGVLESYFGAYVNQWLINEGLFEKDRCPDPKNVLFYANSIQRTIATAQYFSAGMFPGCNIPVENKMAIGKDDPLFATKLSEDSPEFVAKVIQAINTKAGEGGVNALAENLKDEFKEIEGLLDYSHSIACLKNHQCDTASLPIVYETIAGKYPKVGGGVFFTTSITNVFLLQYYEGFKEEDIAWGKITRQSQWDLIGKHKNLYFDLVYANPVVADHIAKKWRIIFMKRF